MSQNQNLYLSKSIQILKLVFSFITNRQSDKQTQPSHQSNKLMPESDFIYKICFFNNNGWVINRSNITPMMVPIIKYFYLWLKVSHLPLTVMWFVNGSVLTYTEWLHRRHFETTEVIGEWSPTEWWLLTISNNYQRGLNKPPMQCCILN